VTIGAQKKEVLCTSKTWIGRADCKHCAIRSRVLFSDLSAEELDSILEPIEVYCFPPGATIYDEGGEDEILYTVRTGRVKLARYLSDGTSRIVRLLRQGDAFGLERLIKKGYEHSAIALNRVNVCSIPTRVLKELDRTNPGVHRQLLERWNEHLRHADDCIAFLSTGPIRRRVVYLINQLAEPVKRGGDQKVKLLGREDMAAMLGVRVESLSRVIAELKRVEILRPLGNDIYEYDAELLQSYAED